MSLIRKFKLLYSFGTLGLKVRLLSSIGHSPRNRYTWFLRCKSYLFSSHKRIKKWRLSRIPSANKSKLKESISGTVLCFLLLFTNSACVIWDPLAYLIFRIASIASFEWLITSAVVSQLWIVTIESHKHK